ncbi:MAG: magnesium transporter [Gammaproteobacteria bacterium]|nr:MAG: magnesium transporter [Gammaproteobacteria bacterium]
MPTNPGDTDNRSGSPRSAVEVEASIEEVLKCIRADDPAGANNAVDGWSAEDLADLMVHMPLHYARTFLEWLPKQKASRVLADMHWNYRAALSRTESASHLTQWLGEMPPEAALETYRSLPKRMRGRMARLLTDIEALQDSRKYPDGTAGAIMDRRVMMVPLESTASEAMEAIKHAFELQGTAGTVFVVEADRRLVGIFRPRDLMVAAPDTPIRDIMVTDFPVVHAHARQDDAAHITQGEGYMSLPVVDAEGRLLGRITPKLREQILAEEQRKDLLRMSQVSPDARATDGFLQIVSGRLPWLLAGLIGATIAAFIIGSFEEELEKAAILAAFIPVVMSMAGNSGLQASGVSVQVLASGTMWPGDRLASRLLRELAGALSNGAIAGIILAMLVMVMSGLFDIENAARLAIATSFSLMTVTTIAALVGASVPFGLNRFGIDPAAATGVFITTSNDVLGVLVYFTMADLFYF